MKSYRVASRRRGEREMRARSQARIRSLTLQESRARLEISALKSDMTRIRKFADDMWLANINLRQSKETEAGILKRRISYDEGHIDMVRMRISDIRAWSEMLVQKLQELEQYAK